jgi:hypothetical protein
MPALARCLALSVLVLVLPASAHAQVWVRIQCGSGPFSEDAATNTRLITLERNASEAAAALSVNVAVRMFGSEAISPDVEGPWPRAVPFPAGATTTTFPIVAVDDRIVEDGELLDIVVLPGEGYRPGASCTTRIDDNDQDVTVSIAATAPSATEGGAPGRFTIRREGDPDTFMTVAFEVRGTAVHGHDYVAFPSTTRFSFRNLPEWGTIELTPGMTEVSLDVVALDDRVFGERDETVEVHIAPGAYDIGTPDRATVTIRDNDGTPPAGATVVTATVEGDGFAREDTAFPGSPRYDRRGGPPLPVSVTIARTGPVDAPLEVGFTLGGTAILGTDYEPIPSRVTLAAGAHTATVVVTPINDDIGVCPLGTAYGRDNANKSVVLTLAEDPAYVLGAQDRAVVNILDLEDAVCVIEPLTAWPNPAGVGQTVELSVFVSNALRGPSEFDYFEIEGWDFGDGETGPRTGAEQRIEHVYARPGTYVASVRVGKHIRDLGSTSVRPPVYAFTLTTTVVIGDQPVDAGPRPPRGGDAGPVLGGADGGMPMRLPDGAIVDPGPGPGAMDGCGCRAAGRSSGLGSGLVLALVALAVWRRRR